MNHDTKSKIRLIAFSLCTAAFASIAIPGCATQADELCDLECECERCSDRARDECGINNAAFVDRASIYGCDAELDEYLQCAVDDNDCDDNDFEIDDSCNDERDDLFECIADNSDLGGSTGSGSGGGGGGNVVNCDCTCQCTDTGTMDFPLMGGCDASAQSCTCQDICNDVVCADLSGATLADGTCQ